MKVELAHRVVKQEQERQFPKLMKIRDSDTVSIVLFLSKDEGIAIYEDDFAEDPFDLMEFQNDWDIDQFEDYTDKIILSND